MAAQAPPQLPRWTPLAAPGPLDDGAAICRVEDEDLVIANVGGELFAAQAHCPQHDASMQGGSLSGYSWICPHGAGCVYDIRSGARLGGGPSLVCLPVRRDERNQVQIGFGIPFEPRLPAF